MAPLAFPSVRWSNPVDSQALFPTQKGLADASPLEFGFTRQSAVSAFAFSAFSVNN